MGLPTPEQTALQSIRVRTCLPSSRARLRMRAAQLGQQLGRAVAALQLLGHIALANCSEALPG